MRFFMTPQNVSMNDTTPYPPDSKGSQVFAFTPFQTDLLNQIEGQKDFVGPGNGTANLGS